MSQNIENIIDQLLVPPYKSTIEDDLKSRLFMDGKGGMMNFYLKTLLKKHDSDNNYFFI